MEQKKYDEAMKNNPYYLRKERKRIKKKTEKAANKSSVQMMAKIMAMI